FRLSRYLCARVGRKLFRCSATIALSPCLIGAHWSVCTLPLDTYLLLDYNRNVRQTSNILYRSDKTPRRQKARRAPVDVDRERHNVPTVHLRGTLGKGPVEMPMLPAGLVIRTSDQYRAIADPTRRRILGILQNEPATAKQLAERLKIAPGTAAHHVQVLEKVGLAKVVALRKVRGIIAKYYTRTARYFAHELPSELTGGTTRGLEVVENIRDEFAEALADS